MNRLPLLAALLAGIGTTLVLSEIRWFRVLPLDRRLAPYRSGLGRAPVPTPGSSVTPFREVIGPLLVTGASRLAAALGSADSLQLRLQRSGAHTTPHEFRLRQGASAVVAALIAVSIAASTPAPTVARIAIVAASPVLTVLLSEHALARRSTMWQQRVLHELPTITEQLGMLMGAGYSMTAAMSRIAARTSGECSSEFQLVLNRIAQGVDESTALQESADRIDIKAYRRLVAVLTLNREAADLGTLITNEAQHIRHVVHREQMEMLEARGQQVWIPVTVATLLPGVVFLAIPFVDAMTQLTN